MRAPAALVVCAISTAGTAALAACFDLFHSTVSIETACQHDAAGRGCTPVTLCATDAGLARERAQHACAWLGACETPLGRNAFGPCMMQALLAYDCAANPNHGFKGDVAAFWTCVADVQSCDDVADCLFGVAAPSCRDGGDSVSCADAGARVECSEGTAHGESCAAWGQTCAATSSGGTCGGSATGTCPSEGTGCYDDAAIHWCFDDAGEDIGVDCSGFGAQTCTGFPRDGAAWVACLAEGESAEGGCEPSTAVTCDGGVAFSCPSGIPESLDCAVLLGSPAACREGSLSPPFDWTSPCAVVPAACTVDACDGGTLTGCERGAPLSVDCANEGLGACRSVRTENGSRSGAACTPP
jgi:hypothetical protein